MGACCGKQARAVPDGAGEGNRESHGDPDTATRQASERNNTQESGRQGADVDGASSTNSHVDGRGSGIVDAAGVEIAWQEAQSELSSQTPSTPRDEDATDIAPGKSSKRAVTRRRTSSKRASARRSSKRSSPRVSVHSPRSPRNSARAALPAATLRDIAQARRTQNIGTVGKGGPAFRGRSSQQSPRTSASPAQGAMKGLAPVGANVRLTYAGEAADWRAQQGAGFKEETMNATKARGAHSFVKGGGQGGGTAVGRAGSQVTPAQAAMKGLAPQGAAVNLQYQGEAADWRAQQADGFKEETMSGTKARGAHSFTTAGGQGRGTPGNTSPRGGQQIAPAQAAMKGMAPQGAAVKLQYQGEAADWRAQQREGFKEETMSGTKARGAHSFTTAGGQGQGAPGNTSPRGGQQIAPAQAAMKGLAPQGAAVKLQYQGEAADWRAQQADGFKEETMSSTKARGAHSFTTAGGQGQGAPGNTSPRGGQQIAPAQAAMKGMAPQGAAVKLQYQGEAADWRAQQADGFKEETMSGTKARGAHSFTTAGGQGQGTPGNTSPRGGQQIAPAQAAMKGMAPQGAAVKLQYQGEAADWRAQQREGFKEETMSGTKARGAHSFTTAGGQGQGTPGNTSPRGGQQIAPAQAAMKGLAPQGAAVKLQYQGEAADWRAQQREGFKEETMSGTKARGAHSFTKGGGQGGQGGQVGGQPGFAPQISPAQGAMKGLAPRGASVKLTYAGENASYKGQQGNGFKEETMSAQKAKGAHNFAVV